MDCQRRGPIFLLTKIGSRNSIRMAPCSWRAPTALRRWVGIFTTRAAAEEFVAGDPFVIDGVVGKYIIHEWSEALAP